MKYLLWGGLLSLVLSTTGWSQSSSISGTVTEKATGETLPGVHVQVAGTTNGTITDFNGFYTLAVSEDADSLTFSFIGMNATTVAINGRTTIDIALSDDVTQLEEVIIVAYGTSTKEAFTGAAEVVEKKVLEDRPVTSFEKSLQGTTAGLQVSSSSGQPGATASVRIRGIGSLSAGSSPLYVIDGVPMSGSLTDLNPNDIESLTVLKDAAASSLYGSRAANGVIIVTTKQGTKGQTQISFNGQLGVASRISDGYALMNSTQFYEQTWLGLYNQAILDGQTNSDAKDYAHNNVESIVGFNPFGIEDPLDEDGQLKPGTLVQTNTDWRDEIYKTGVVQNYNLNVSGGNDLTKVFFSLGYLKDGGTTIGSNFSRYTAKLNVTHKVNNFITAGMNNLLSYTVTNAPPSGSGGANPVRSAEMINAASPIYNADGSYNWDNKAVFDFNPVALNEMDIYRYKGKRALINAYLDFKITPALSFRTTGAVDYSNNEGLEYYNPFHGNGAGVNGRSTSSSANNLAWNISNILTWNKEFSDSDLELLLGQEAHGEQYSMLSAGVTDFSIPGYPDLIWGAKPEAPGSYTSGWNMISFLGQAKYNYGSKYYLSASVRTDGSSRFGRHNKYGVFYSVGASWRLVEESWMPKLRWLDNLKLRASYGTSGNNNIGNYASLGLYGSGANYGGYPGLTPTQLPNDRLSWEKITSLNVGIETLIFDRVNATIEYYNRASDGLLFAKPLSSGKGFTSILTNLGAMVNSGLEVSVAYDVISNENIGYTISANVSSNHNTILNLTTDQIVSGTKLLEEGSSVYQFYMREWAGVNPDNGTPMWFTNAQSDDEESDIEPSSSYADPLGRGRNVTSDYNDAERIRLGSSLPRFYGGLSNSFRYKGFNLSFYFYYSLGGKVYNYDYAGNMHDGTQPGSNLALDAAKSWTPNNIHTNVPRYVVNNQDQSNQLSSRFLEDASYLRLKNISLRYNLPAAICERYQMSGLQVFLSAENIWTLTKYKGFDPEGALSGTTNNSIPGVKVVTMGLKIDL